MNEEEVKVYESTINVKIPEYDDKEVKIAVDNALKNIKRIDQAFLETNGAIIIKELLHRVDKLQNNWNELKKFIEEKMSVYEHKEASNFYVVFEKMQELQGDDKN